MFAIRYVSTQIYPRQFNRTMKYGRYFFFLSLSISALYYYLFEVEHDLSQEYNCARGCIMIITFCHIGRRIFHRSCKEHIDRTYEKKKLPTYIGRLARALLPQFVRKISIGRKEMDNYYKFRHVSLIFVNPNQHHTILVRGFFYNDIITNCFFFFSSNSSVKHSRNCALQYAQVPRITIRNVLLPYL